MTRLFFSILSILRAVSKVLARIDFSALDFEFSMIAPMPLKRKTCRRRHLKHDLKIFWRKHWTVVLAILFGLFTALYFIPSLIRFLSETD